MEWYIPISLLPGIAILIMSTGNFIVALNAELKELKKQFTLYEVIIKLKIQQLRRLSIAIAGLYLSVFVFTLLGFFIWFGVPEVIDYIVLVIAFLIMTYAVFLLVSFSIRAIKIRDLHMQIEEK
jgi:hypothetical protein